MERIISTVIIVIAVGLLAHFSGFITLPFLDDLIHGNASLENIEDQIDFDSTKIVRRVEYAEVPISKSKVFTINLKRGLFDQIPCPNNVKQIKYIKEKSGTCTYFVDFRDSLNFGIIESLNPPGFYIREDIVPQKKCGDYSTEQRFEPDCFSSIESIPNDALRLQISELLTKADDNIDSTFNYLATQHPTMEIVVNEARVVRDEIIAYYTSKGYQRVAPPTHLIDARNN